MHMKKRLSKQSFWFGLIILLPSYLVFGSIIVSAFLKFFLQLLSIQFSQLEMSGYLNFCFDLLFIVVAYFILNKEIKEQWQEFKNKNLMDILNRVVWAIPLLYLANIVGNFMTMIFTGSLSTSENQQIIETLIQELPFLMIVSTTILAPVLEEFIFRLLLFTGFYKYGRWIAYLVSAGLFGLLHVYQPLLQGQWSEILLIFPYLFMGGVLCYIYEKSDNIYIPILSHALINTISVILLMI